MPNFHYVFEKRMEPRCYRQSITPTEPDRKQLFEAKDKVRRHLLAVIPQLTEEAFGKEGRSTPKFRVQGSWTYDTCNAPCHDSQEMDLDYGVYLPVSTWEDSGLPPQAAAPVYFSIMERALMPLIQKEGWTLVDDKDTCVRIQIKGINAHIDVPLYVAPDAEFKRLVEARMHLAKTSMTADMAFAESEIDEQPWHDFEKIALAMRDGTWKPSDPRKVSDWFNTSVQRHGSQLRRVCRYLKGMRDFHWAAGGPSSLLLMICATQRWQGFEDRDDLALLHILEEIGPMLLGPVYCPEISDEDFNRIEEIERHAVKNWADTAAVVLKDVINNSRMHQLQEAFGKLQFTIDHRIPTAPELVGVDSTPASIRAYAPAIVPQKRHEESRAG